ncbi:2,3-diaminopropionate biosynthesis protein SbnA [Pelagicoccus sp. SDUM812002]|uniref:2,3-diaminopropionate biosynthesis protein SbnA n=1 Tax=Pelagicoccus sp. SDUM812002 TaxID=3041266 RepID=UPI00280F3A1D|nr:2,3-diaminopropionate biosynthesis protein SbnA [Pelagicoccus sp. SDUM812002]MDQ8187611.1 2,3-diaminopropionate biosynthesis protein SbnA [Pelagicoccus sp. SDUM812002]
MIQIPNSVASSNPYGFDTLRFRNEGICEGILGAVGDTPLVRLSRYLDQTDVELFAKVESCNPGGSAKDRPALKMIEDALESGELEVGQTVVESTSGNMGIGLAQACRYYGLKLICVVDPNAQRQNVAIMQALGAEIEWVEQPVNGDFLSARLLRVSQIIRDNPDAYWTNQYGNERNPAAHFEGTIQEIDDKLGDSYDVVFVATSSTGTARGCRDFLIERRPKVQVVAVDAEGSVLFGGEKGRRKIPGLGAGVMPELAEGQTFDTHCRVSDLRCVVGCRRLAEREAMLVGGSAGGVLEAVRSMQSQLSGKRCVAILHDSGMRYLDTIYSDQWVEDTLGAKPADLQSLVDANWVECLEQSKD